MDIDKYLEFFYGASTKATIKKMQKEFGLTTDGVVGPKTKRAMEKPRCGCRAERLVTNHNRWTKGKLDYKIDGYVGGISKKTQRDIFQDAFDQWSRIIGVRFKRTWRRFGTEIRIKVGSGRRWGMDGVGGTLAWAELPDGRNSSSKIVFDKSEDWTETKLRNVATHECGHIIGLTHSSNPLDLMAPAYNKNVGVPQNGDVRRAKALYR